MRASSDLFNVLQSDYMRAIRVFSSLSRACRDGESCSYRGNLHLRARLFCFSVSRREGALLALAPHWWSLTRGSICASPICDAGAGVRFRAASVSYYWLAISLVCFLFARAERVVLRLRGVSSWSLECVLYVFSPLGPAASGLRHSKILKTVY